MAVITFYKTTLDGENYPDFLEEYLEGCEKKEVTVKAVNPGRESYTISLDDLLPAGMNYAKIEQVRAAFFYKVENLLAPVGDTSYPYVLTLDKFATAAFNASLIQSGTGSLLEFNAKNFYGDGTAATGAGQSPVDSEINMAKIGRNAFTFSYGKTLGFYPLIFVTVDGDPGILTPSTRMEDEFPDGLAEDVAADYGRWAAQLAAAGALKEWGVKEDGTFTTDTLSGVKVDSVYIIPAVTWYSLGAGDITFFLKYSDKNLTKYEATLTGEPATTPSEIAASRSWRIARSLRGSFSQISTISAHSVAIFGGATSQVQTMPCGVIRKIEYALHAAAGGLSLVLRDEYGGAVECAPSCKLPLILPTETKTEEALRKTATAIGTGVTIVGVAGSVAAGNPLGIAAAVGGLGGNVVGAARQFVQPPPTAASTGASFMDLNGGWAPVFLHTVPLARKIDEYGYTPARFLDWKNAAKVPTQHHPVFFHGAISGAETLLPESWLNDGFSQGVRVWLKDELDDRAEVLVL